MRKQFECQKIEIESNLKFYYNFRKIHQERIERKNWMKDIYCKIAIGFNAAFYFMN